jgi:drug/metabolite transporter (DMT)-like permease
MNATLKDHAHLHFIVLIWGFTAILGLLISIPSVELVFFRTLIAAIGLGFMLYLRKQNLRIGLGEVIRLLVTGCLISAHWILFFGAARVANASVCLAGMATSSLWTSILEPIMGGKQIRMLEIAIGLVVIAGLYTIFHFEFDHALGIVMAVSSAMLAALFSVLNSRFSRRQNAFVITFYEMVGAFMGTAVFLPFYAFWIVPDAPLNLHPSLYDWLWITVLALVCTVYAYSSAVKLLQKFSVFAMNLTINLEPVYGIILAFLIFGDSEKMTPGFYLGTLILLAAVLIYPTLNRMRLKTTA